MSCLRIRTTAAQEFLSPSWRLPRTNLQVIAIVDQLCNANESEGGEHALYKQPAPMCMLRCEEQR